MRSTENNIRPLAIAQTHEQPHIAQIGRPRRWGFCIAKSTFATFQRMQLHAAKQLTLTAAKARNAKLRNPRAPDTFCLFVRRRPSNIRALRQAGKRRPAETPPCCFPQSPSLPFSLLAPHNSLLITGFIARTEPDTMPDSAILRLLTVSHSACCQRSFNRQSTAFVMQKSDFCECPEIAENHLFYRLKTLFATS